MLTEDKNNLKAAKKRVQRYHHGPVGQVLHRFLDHHGAAPQDFSLTELEQLWLQAAEQDPAIGLHLFSHFTRQDWHVLVYLSTYAATLKESLDCWVRYASLASSGDKVSCVREGELAGVEISMDAPAALERFLVEHYMTMALTQLSESCDQQTLPVRACFRHARPPYWSQYTKLFGENLVFSAPANQLWFEPAALALTIQSRNSGLFEVICSELDRRLAQQQRFGGIAGKLAELAREQMLQGETPALEPLASALHQTPRTVRRRLQEQGLTFRQLLDTVRAELDNYLELQGLSRAQIAEQLGYSDTPAYLNARKRWAGQG